MIEAGPREARAAGDAGAPTNARVEELAHELALSREIRRRLEAEVRRLETRVAALETETGQLHGVLAERERYLQAVQGSLVWRSAQSLRRLAGRAW